MAALEKIFVKVPGWSSADDGDCGERLAASATLCAGVVRVSLLKEGAKRGWVDGGWEFWFGTFEGAVRVAGAEVLGCAYHGGGAVDADLGATAPREDLGELGVQDAVWRRNGRDGQSAFIRRMCKGE